jgi:hypothetical protein
LNDSTETSHNEIKNLSLSFREEDMAVSIPPSSFLNLGQAIVDSQS